jgi:hypothetical protein
MVEPLCNVIQVKTNRVSAKSLFFTVDNNEYFYSIKNQSKNKI